MNVSSYQRLATTSGHAEVIHAFLWDTINYVTTVTLNLVFFQTVKATLDLSNMEIGGQLPAPRQFLIRAMRLFLKQRPESVALAAAAVQTGAIDNVAQLFNNAAVVITIGSKEYGRYPAHLFTAGGGVDGQLNVQDVLIAGAYADYGQLGKPSAKNIFTFATPMLIEPQINFNVTLSWAAALTLTRTLPICVCLEGDLIRPIQ